MAPFERMGRDDRHGLLPYQTASPISQWNPHANNTAVVTANPAMSGETVTIYATGLGQLSSLVPTGELPSGSVTTSTMPTCTIDGIGAQVQFSGLAGCCVGVNQINVIVPSRIRTGTNVPVIVNVGGQQSNTVNMASK
jgi:uncharacterized protein (TIGR03437 family)